MLSTQYFFLIFIHNKKLRYIIILSLLYGWILLSLLSSFNLIISSKQKKFFQPFKIILFLNSKKIWKILYIYILGFNLLSKKHFTLLGTGYKINIKYNKFLLRFGISNKLIINLLQNIKIYITKKVFISIKTRYWNLIKLLSYKLKQLSFNGIYKKKGIYFKNELVSLKQGKVSKN